MIFKNKKNPYFSTPAPPPENLKFKAEASALSPLLIVLIAVLSSLLFFTVAVLVPEFRLTSSLIGIVTALLIFLVLSLVRQSTLRKLAQSQTRQTSPIKVMDGKLHIPNYLKYDSPTPPNQWQEQYSIFEIAELLDFELRKAVGRNPATFIFATKIKGKKSTFSFINSLEKRQEDLFLSTLKDSLPESHYILRK